MNQVYAYGKKGHAALINYGDDGMIHIDAFRKQGGKIVHIGKYEIKITELRELLAEGK